jgi:hypothetical protein
MALNLWILLNLYTFEVDYSCTDFSMKSKPFKAVAGTVVSMEVASLLIDGHVYIVEQAVLFAGRRRVFTFLFNKNKAFVQKTTTVLGK